jgi:peptide-methionine (S)-S-oxide reductase
MSTLETATLGGGCFWCTEAVFQLVRGVHHVESGYAGGHTLNPTYEDICTGETGHAEVIQIQFDTTLISYEQILHIFFSTHDATTLNRQGHDVGTQYRSVIFTHSAAQANIAAQVVQQAQLHSPLPCH